MPSHAFANNKFTKRNSIADRDRHVCSRCYIERASHAYGLSG